MEHAAKDPQMTTDLLLGNQCKVQAVKEKILASRASSRTYIRS